jgi:ectoine hydroxylase-related dioxygenase (phytanoyl-CoA dioxygenase family)
MVPGLKTTFENGATTAIPGSHLWGSDRAPRTSEAIVAEMEVTDCWVMLGGLYHAGGANIIESERRILHGFFFARGFYRGEENIYLANSAEDVLSWSPEVQRSWDTSFPVLTSDLSISRHRYSISVASSLTNTEILIFLRKRNKDGRSDRCSFLLLVGIVINLIHR